MKWSSPLLLVLFLGILLFSSCTSTERAARAQRKAEFYAQKQSRKRGEITKHVIGERPGDAQAASRSKKKRSRSFFRSDEPASSDRITGTRKLDRGDISTIIRTARSYTGTPYLAGGTTRIGMDCSGLIVTSFESVDIKLPRNSTEQSNYGLSLSLDELKEGDLVFFGAGKNSQQVTHVGLVTDVKSKEEILFIHSSTSLGVTENNLYSRYYYDRFIKGSRPYLQP